MLKRLPISISRRPYEWLLYGMVVVPFGVGLLVMWAWYTTTPSLITLLPGAPAMQFNTALGLVVSSVSLFLFLRQQKYAVYGLSGLFLILCLMTFLQYVFNRDLGVDQLFFRVASAEGVAFPGRMSPNSALAFVVLNASLVFNLAWPDLRASWVSLGVSSSLVLGIAAASSIGYLGNIEAAYRWGLFSGIGMAVHTSIAFILLSGALLLHEWQRESRVGTFPRWFIFLAWVVGVVITLIIWQTIDLVGPKAVLVGGFLIATLFALSLRAIELEQVSKALADEIQLREEISQSLESHESQLAGVLDSAMDAIISISEDQRIIRFNPSAEIIFGYAADEVLGRPIEMLIPERFRSNHREHIRDFANTGVSNRSMGKLGVLSGLRANGREFPIEASISQFESTGATTFTVILRDVTERVRAENELRTMIDQLRQSNEELEQFAYVSSHDLQEPLRVISSYLELIERFYADKLDDEGREYIDFILDASSRMKNLIQDLLAFSRVGTRRKEAEAVDSAEALETALSYLQPGIEENDVDLKLGEILPVTADRDQLVQVFQNLVSNAIKYRDERPLTIKIDSRMDGDDVQFTVSDNGIGFEQKHAERIFIIFKQLHSRQEYEGTGIGLAIVKKIIELHGGRIWAEGKPGKGATFHFTLPKQRDEEEIQEESLEERARRML
jgi:PAS domain S-box-containing protein